MNEKKLKAIFVDVIPPNITSEHAEKRLEELENLVNTYGGIVVLKIIQKKEVPDYDTYVGKGKVQEICELAEEHKADVLIVNNILKVRQIFKLDEIFRKKELEVKTWDRMDLILKIFDRHAKTTEAKLQIELASIRHMGARIFGMGIELSRQGGAMGLRAGQGESNTEMMKRHLQAQELSILKKLKHYETINEGHRAQRRRQNFKTAALVGYTNAGKSSLLKALTGKDVYIADQLFATLDTRVGKLFIKPKTTSEDGNYQPGKEILVSDTIGFIQDLPPELIKAFKSTLSETVDADLLIHVIDISDPHIIHKVKVVEDVLDQLGVGDKPKIYAFNKLDLIAPADIFQHNKQPKRPSLLKAGTETAELLGWSSFDAKKRAEALKQVKKLRNAYEKHTPVFVSAHKKRHLEDLIEVISKLL